MDKLKVLMFTELFPCPENPTSGTFIYELSKAVSRHCAVSVIHPRIVFLGYGSKRTPPSFRDHGNGESVDFEVVRPSVFLPAKGDRLFFRGFWFFLYSLMPVLKMRLRFDFHIIHAHMVCPSGFAALLLGKLLRKPVVITGWGSDIHTYPARFFMRHMTRLTLKKADGLVMVSRNLKDLAVRLGAREDRLSVIYNGVNIERFTPRNRQTVRKELGLPLDRFIVLFVGALIERKGVFCLMKAVDILSRSRPDLLLVLVGQGDLRQALQAYCTENSIENAVYFAGPHHHTEIPTWMNAADLLCLPSFHEGLPTVVVEALACGVPVVASAVGGTPEVIDNASVGRLCKPADVPDLERTLMEAIRTTWDRSAIVNKGRQYDWAMLATQYEELYRNLVRYRYR